MAIPSTPPLRHVSVVLLSAVLLTWGSPVSADGSGVTPFKKYPPNDYCGVGADSRPSLWRDQICPMNVCETQRAACDQANSDRVKYLVDTKAVPWPVKRSGYKAVYDAAAATCKVASDCVAHQCNRVKPWNGRGFRCRVRSYATGQCCCWTCCCGRTGGVQQTIDPA